MDEICLIKMMYLIVDMNNYNIIIQESNPVKL